MRLLVTSILSLAVLALFIGLGTWQVQRLQWKAGVLAEIDARIGAAPVAVPENPIRTRDKYLPIFAEGILGDGVQVLASTRDQGAGYRIIQVLELENGRRVLLDRGFQPIAAHTAIGFPIAVSVTGNLHWPDEVDRWTPDPEPDRALWFARDVAAIARHLDTEPVMIILRQITPALPSVTAMPVTSEGVPNRHLEYAVTWFLLALTWAVMTGYVLWRMKRRTS